MEVTDGAPPVLREGVMAFDAEGHGRLPELQGTVDLEAGGRSLTELRREKLEQLPSQLRAESALLPDELVGPDKEVTFAIQNLTRKEREQIVKRALATTDQDNGVYYQKYRSRLDRVELAQPSVEIRFDDLTIEAGVYVGGRALPNLLNASRNAMESLLRVLHLTRDNRRRFQILRKVSGVLKPGRLTLLLGPPGCGKSSLLLALANRLDSNLKVTGSITYNGHTAKEFSPKRTVTYVPQVDLHIGELTVRETLDFGARCLRAGTNKDLVRELGRREVADAIVPDPDIDAFMKASALEGQKENLVTDYVMKILGLDICADTLVGNQLIRGVSGGQRKRVTTGELLVGSKKVLLLDEISTGLDSSTTFQIVNCLQNICHYTKSTVFTSLLQPAPETFELFDDVVLLSEGHVIYQGPRERILDFFEMQGFRCPKRKGVADFLQEVTSRKDQEQYWARDTPYTYVPVSSFADAFDDFEVGRLIRKELSQPFDKARSLPGALVPSKAGRDFEWGIFRACLDREWTLMKRNSFLYIVKTVQCALLAIISATVFLRTTLNSDSIADGSLYLSMIFFSLVYIMFNSYAEISLTVHRLPIFFKQREDQFYPAWAFNLPSIITRLPYTLVEVLIWTALTYYIVGLAPDAGRFFTYFLILLALHQMGVALFRLVGVLARTMTMANTAGSFALMCIFLLGGFVIAKPQIHPWWIWGFWISPLSYVQQGMAINEFSAPRWQKLAPGSNETIGASVLTARGLFHEHWWVWVSVGVMVGYAILFNVLINLALDYFPPIGTAQAIISEDVLDEKEKARVGHVTDALNVSVLIPVVEAASGADERAGTPVAKENTGVHRRAIIVPETQIELAQSRTPGSRRSRTPGSSRRASVTPSGLGQPSPSGLAQYYEKVGGAKRGMVLPFEPLSMVFHDVWYSVDVPKGLAKEGEEGNKLQILKGCSGAFRPGVLTALVGVSGAGKTTLMDVLAGRKTTGYVEGDVFVGGFPKEQDSFARVSGYVEQFDIHSPSTTVFEALTFSAWLRLSETVDPQTRKEFVEEVMELVELIPLRNALVGSPGVSGLPVEARKRLTIAVELVANPSIIFMDEPTSGLDARAAAIVMRTVRNTVDTGRTVVCTIHQPSIDIFEAFDELLLMKRGGHVIYAGPLGTKSKFLVEHFSAVRGVPQIRDGHNPSTWMLEVTTPGMEEKLGVDFAEYYKSSTLFKRNEDLIAKLSKPMEGASKLRFDSKYSRSFGVQFTACFWKNSRTYWQTPEYTGVRYFFSAGVALIFGSIFWDLGQIRNTQQNVFNVMGAIYASVLFLGTSNASSVQPVFSKERAVSYRERGAGMYSPTAWVLALCAIEVPYVLVQTVLYSCITYSMINFEWTAIKFFEYMAVMFLTFLIFTYYGIMVVAATPGLALASIISSFFYSFWNLFAGFLIPLPRIPGWWVWYYYINPISWTLYGLIASQLGDVNDEYILETNGAKDKTVSEFVRSHLGFKHEYVPVALACLLGFVIIFFLLAVMAVRFLNYQKR
ncbi:pleiotropic drug resistance protein [Klebsormidium nitens]|uniref:Pleiotropic drug resistance protein n=1 Tax=Klebsormidium nitens TaxID=105231 RepID=A0A1Y1IQP2_KLENI|nr:pleiotropic drug resistance protein [Klebsormidium nitens]|eukprot:GAQ91789.1 pleiotropic drug resistance protein [Klebsormidium nitens]